MVLHQLIDRAFRGTRCWFVFGAGVWFVFGGVQAAHEGSPVGLDDFRCAEVEELLDEDEHAGA